MHGFKHNWNKYHNKYVAMRHAQWQPAGAVPIVCVLFFTFFPVNFYFVKVCFSGFQLSWRLSTFKLCLLLCFCYLHFLLQRATQLMELSKMALLPGVRPGIPDELWRKRRGCRAEAKRGDMRRNDKPSVPAIVIGNVRSLGTKTDELRALVGNPMGMSWVQHHVFHWDMAAHPGSQCCYTRLQDCMDWQGHYSKH